MKSLEALKRLKQETAPTTYMEDFDKEECCNVIAKELKALEIIKKKKVNVSALLELDNLEQYNVYCAAVGGCKYLTQEEYVLLKEVLL